VNPFVNAVTATCFERARAEARAAESAVMRGDTLGLLHGLPLGVKDLEPTEGLLTTWGSPIYRDHVPTEKDIELVARLRRAGAIVAGKTNVPEMGAGANSRNDVWGATGNPFDPNLNAGGSSGGSAAALACDMLPVCTGSDTGGSLRIPAAKCGVVGFRPSPGIVPSVRKPLGWTPISVVGPMGRTVEDACLQTGRFRRHARGRPAELPARSDVVPGARARRPGRPARGVDRRLRHLRRGRRHPRHLPPKDRGHAAPVPPLRQGRLRHGRGAPLLRRAAR
jgi:amidase